MLSIDHIISINHIIKIPWLFPSLFEFLSDFSNDNFLILDNKIKLTEPMFYIDKLCSEAAAADLSWLSPTPSANLYTARREKEEPPPTMPCIISEDSEQNPCGEKRKIRQSLHFMRPNVSFGQNYPTGQLDTLADSLWHKCTLDLFMHGRQLSLCLESQQAHSSSNLNVRCHTRHGSYCSRASKD